MLVTVSRTGGTRLVVFVTTPSTLSTVWLTTPRGSKSALCVRFWSGWSTFRWTTPSRQAGIAVVAFTSGVAFHWGGPAVGTESVRRVAHCIVSFTIVHESGTTVASVCTSPAA